MDTIKNFSIEQMAGQRLMVGFDGTECNRDLEFLIRDLKVGGIILFAQNIENPNQLTALCKSIQDIARSNGQPPIFIAIDQEGGTVARLRKPYFTEFPALTELKTESDVKTFSTQMAAQLSELCINMNMAPVMDVVPKDVDSIMKNRIFSHDPRQVAKMGRILIENHQKKNIMAVAKHFPGIGRTTLDSHLDLPELAATVKDLESFDLIPFSAAIDAQVSGIMLSHIRYTGIDAKWPASLSSVMTHDLLRKKMEFNGIIMTDDLDMGAIKNHYDINTVIQQILSADVDIALICHKGPNIEIACEIIKKSISKDKVLEEKNKKSLHRIMQCKQNLRAHSKINLNNPEVMYMSGKKAAHAIISGRVQGVFFRMETRRAAERMGVTGWVRNRSDGTVEAVFEGDSPKVEQVIAWCKKGPPMASVSDIEIDEIEYTKEYSDFSIRY